MIKSDLTPVLGKIVGQTEFFSLGLTNNLERKLCLKIDLVLHPACGRGVGSIHIMPPHCKQHSP